MEGSMKKARKMVNGWPGDQRFFAVGVVMPDGSVVGFGKPDRTWPSVEAFHAERGKKAANLILFFPAEEDA